MKAHSSPLEIDLDRAFEPTPASFSRHVAGALKEIRKPVTGKKRKRWLPILLTCLLLLGGSAVAARSLGVMDFLMPSDKSAVEESVKKPLSQSCDDGRVLITARDYLWHDMTLSLAIHVSPAEPDKYRLISQGDFGVDGIHMDDIWWGGEITTMDKWLPKGKQALVMDVLQITIGGKEMACNVGWLPEELGETFLLEINLSYMTAERYAKLHDGQGNIQVSVPVNSWIYGDSQREQSLLLLTIEAPTQEEWRRSYDAE